MHTGDCSARNTAELQYVNHLFVFRAGYLYIFSAVCFSAVLSAVKSLIELHRPRARAPHQTLFLICGVRRRGKSSAPLRVINLPLGWANNCLWK